MGIDQRRERERQVRIEGILEAAWHVAAELGWGAFSVERVAARAELGRATIYSYFISIDELVVEMASRALTDLRERLADADSVERSLDVPVRLAQETPARFELLFPQARDTRSHMSSRELRDVRQQARDLLGRLERVAEKQAGALPEDAKQRAAFLAGVSMAGATVPELKASTTLRHQWQEFCLGPAGSPQGSPQAPGPAKKSKP